MKKGWIIAIGVAIVLFMYVGSVYNSMVNSQERVEQAWSQVENVYQRRADLIPNLVATVKGYAAHESETLESVVEARSKATSLRVDPADLTPENIERFQAAQGELNAALGRLLMLTENYPDLKANQNFLELQSELSGTENRISVERKKFNEAAQTYNSKIRRFPANMFASLFGFERKAYFEASEEARTAPKVEF